MATFTRTPAPSRPATGRRGLLAAAALGLCLPAWPQPASRTTVIRLGQSLPMSGPHAVVAASYRQAAAAAFEEANAQGRGVRYELVSLDDGGDPEQTATNVRHLAATQGAGVLFGFAGEGADRAGAIAAEGAGLPYVAPVSGAVELRSARRPGTFVFTASHAEEIRYIVGHARLVGFGRIALVHAANFLGLEMRNAMLDLADAGAREHLAISAIDSAGSDATVPGAVATVLASQPQAIVLGSNDVAAAALVRALRAAGYKGYVYALSSVGSQGLPARLGPLVTGISVTQVVPLPLTDAPQVCLAHRAFCARHGIAPTLHSMEAWIGATLFIQATAGLRGGAPADIVRALRAAPEQDFGGYAARWSESRPSAAARVSLTVYDRDGRLRS